MADNIAPPAPPEIEFPPIPRLGPFLAQGLVIVASVLFALAVDRIVRGMDESALEQTYLEGLLDDFSAIGRVTAEGKGSAAQRDSASTIVLAAMRNAQPVDSSGLALARALVLTGWVLDLQFARSTWDDMVGTGRLGILTNPELRKEIAAFYRDLDQLQTYAREWVQMAGRYGDVVETMLEPELRVAIGSELILKEAVPPGLSPNVTDLTERLGAAPELRAAIGDVLLINRVSERWYAELDWRARRIEQTIRSELERFGAREGS